MRVFSARYVMPLLVLVVLAVMFVPVSASLFSVPKLDWDGFSFGSSCDQPGTSTTVDQSAAPFASLSAASGISMPAGWSGMFRSPVTTERTYTRSYTTPEGPMTRTVYQSYDGTTGERINTVASA